MGHWFGMWPCCRLVYITPFNCTDFSWEICLEGHIVEMPHSQQPEAESNSGMNGPAIQLVSNNTCWMGLWKWKEPVKIMINTWRMPVYNLVAASVNHTSSARRWCNVSLCIDEIISTMKLVLQNRSGQIGESALTSLIHEEMIHTVCETVMLYQFFSAMAKEKITDTLIRNF